MTLKFDKWLSYAIYLDWKDAETFTWLLAMTIVKWYCAFVSYVLKRVPQYETSLIVWYFMR